MIIWGTRGREVHVGSGHFNCPRCQRQQEYNQKEVKRYFTLYFIPLIPIGTAGGYVECRSCAGTFATEILSYDPEVERQKTAEKFRRLAVLFLLDVKRVTAPTLKALQDIVSDAVDMDIERQDIANDVKMAQNATPDTLKFFKAQTSEFSEQGKFHLLHILRQILESECPLQEHEKSRILELSNAMGLRKSQVTAFLASAPNDES